MIGYKWFGAEGFFWRHHFKSLLPLCMPHVDPRLSYNQAQQLLRDHGVWFLRWDTEFDSNKPSDWWHVIKDNQEVLGDLSRNTRNQIRRGCKHFDVVLVDRIKIKQECYSVYSDTFLDYDTIEKPITHQAFEVLIDNMPEETEFWCVIEKNTNKTVGFSENMVRDSSCFYLNIWIHSAAKHNYAGYALFHEMNKYYLNVKCCKYVSDGARSISHNTNVHKFLESKFGFRKAYSTLNIVYVPWFGTLVRVLYPARKLFNALPTKIFRKISIVLFQEEIKRSHLKKSNNK